MFPLLFSTDFMKALWTADSQAKFSAVKKLYLQKHVPILHIYSYYKP